MSVSGILNRQDPAWQTMRAFIVARIEKLRDALEVERDPIAAAELRGQLISLRGMIAAVEPRPVAFVEMPDEGRDLY